MKVDKGDLVKGSEKSVKLFCGSMIIYSSPVVNILHHIKQQKKKWNTINNVRHMQYTCVDETVQAESKVYKMYLTCCLFLSVHNDIKKYHYLHIFKSL